MKDYYFTSTDKYDTEECKNVEEAVAKRSTAHVIIEGSKKRIHLHFKRTPPHGISREVATAKIAVDIINKYARKWGLSDAIPYVERSGDYTATIAFGGRDNLSYDDYGRQRSPYKHQENIEEWIINSMSD